MATCAEDKQSIVQSIEKEIAIIRQELADCLKEKILEDELTIEESQIISKQIQKYIQFEVITPKLSKHALRKFDTSQFHGEQMQNNSIDQNEKEIDLKNELKNCADHLGDAIYRSILARDLTVAEAMVARDSIEIMMELRVFRKSIDDLKFKKI